MQIVAVSIQQAGNGMLSAGPQKCAERISGFCREYAGRGVFRESLIVPAQGAFELMAVIDSAKIAPEELTAELRAACFETGRLRTQAYQSIEAVRHFLRACATRDTFLEAAGSALQAAQGAAGPILHRLYQTGLMFGARIERERGICDQKELARRITDLYRKIFGTHAADRMLIAGSNPVHEKTAGVISEALKCLALHATTLDEAAPAFADAQIAVRLSDDLRELFAADRLKRLLAARKNRPLLIIELDERIPADAALDDIYNLFVYNRRDLCPQEDQPHPALEHHLDRELKDFFSWFYSTEHYRFGSIIGTSRPMEAVLELIARISQTDITVLIQGESGTGKELIAQAIHENSPRRGRPFIAVNCGALPDTLLESELFGHVRGAFTGAVAGKKGLLEEADGGTLLLDEIGETSPAFQVKLLRVLQQGEMRRVGSTELQKIDVRVLAATNRILRDLVDQGMFRKDLFYRLNVVQIDMPAMRDRRDDLPLLAGYFLQRFSERMKKRIQGISDEALAIIAAYEWPGNVRELENAMERAVALCIGHMITPGDLPPQLFSSQSQATPPRESAELATLRDLERDHIERALRQCRWDYECVARALGIGRTTLWRKIKEYEIEKGGQE